MEEVRELLGSGPVTFYIGFDPTADSLHVGHFIQIMVMMHMQKAGHRPIALIGGGTTLVGDPSGRTDMRKMLTQEKIAANAEKFKKTFSRFLRFEMCIRDRVYTQRGLSLREASNSIKYLFSSS